MTSQKEKSANCKKLDTPTPARVDSEIFGNHRFRDLHRGAMPHHSDSAFATAAPLTLRRLAAPPAPKCAVHRFRCCVSTRTKLHDDLIVALRGLNRGLDFDADAEAEVDTEALVEDAIEALEESPGATAPTADPLRHGNWVLAYSSSSLTRYAGGLTGMHKLLPGGTVGDITLEVDEDVSTWKFCEKLSFEIFGRELGLDVLVDGRVRALDAEREVWLPENARFFGFKFQAETWKSLRAFTNGTVTHLDEKVKIARGTTGAATVFVRPEIADDIDAE